MMSEPTNRSSAQLNILGQVGSIFVLVLRVFGARLIDCVSEVRFGRGMGSEI